MPRCCLQVQQLPWEHLGQEIHFCRIMVRLEHKASLEVQNSNHKNFELVQRHEFDHVGLYRNMFDIKQNQQCTVNTYNMDFVNKAFGDMKCMEST